MSRSSLKELLLRNKWPFNEKLYRKGTHAARLQNNATYQAGVQFKNTRSAGKFTLTPTLRFDPFRGCQLSNPRASRLLQLLFCK